MIRLSIIGLFSLILTGLIIQDRALVLEKSDLQTTRYLRQALPVQLKEAVFNVQQQNVLGKTIWSGQSGGFYIQWTTSDLYTRVAGNVIKIWTPLAERGFADFAAAEQAESNPNEKTPAVKYEYGRRFELLSVVGPLVSFADYYSIFYGNAAPGLDTRFTTINLAKQGDIAYARGDKASVMDIDLTNPGKIVKLTDYFTEQDILRALLNDLIIKKALASLDPPSSPQTLAELLGLFANNGYELGNSGYELRPDALTRFAFHHLEGNKVAVRIGLPPHFGFNKALHRQLGLLLDIPPVLQKQMALAATRQEGFLMKDLAMIGNHQTTKFSSKTNLR